MTLDVIILSVHAAAAAVKYIRRVDGVTAERRIYQARFPLPMAYPEASNLGGAELGEALRKFKEESGNNLPEAAREAERYLGELPAAKAGKLNEINRFLRLVKPELYLDAGDVSRAKADDGRLMDEELRGVFLLKSAGNVPPIAGKILLLSTELIAEAGAGFVPKIIGDKGVANLVQGVLKRYVVVSNDGNGLEEWSEELARRFVNAGIEAVIANAAELRGRTAGLDLALDLLAQFKTGMGQADDWNDYARSFLEQGGLVRFVSVLVKAGGNRLAERSEQETSLFLTELAGKLVQEFGDHRGATGDFFRDHWTDLIAAGLEVIEGHGELLLSEKGGWVEWVVKAAAGAVGPLAAAGDFDAGRMVKAVVVSAGSALLAKPELLDDSVREEGLRKLIASVVGAVAGGGDAGGRELRLAIAASLTSGLIELAANDRELFGKVFAEGDERWIGEFAGRLAEGIDNDAIRRVFEGGSRKEFGEAVVHAAIRTIGVNGRRVVDGVDEAWLAALIAGFSGAAAGLDLQQLAGRNGVRVYLAKAVSLAAEHPALLSQTGDGALLLPVVMAAVENGIAGGPLPRAGIPALLIEGIGGWLAVRGDVRDLDLGVFIASLARAFADASRRRTDLNAVFFEDAISAAARALTDRKDLNYLVRPEAMGLAFEGVFAGGAALGRGGMIQAIGCLAAHFLGEADRDWLERLALAGGAAWKDALAVMVAEALAGAVAADTNALASVDFASRLDATIAGMLAAPAFSV